MKKRFKFLDKKFHPYLEKVMGRIPDEIRQRVLNDACFQIVGEEDFKTCDGMFLRFDSPVQHVVYLNYDILTKPEYSIVHTIAHETAHWIAGKGETGLYEKEAEELLVKWGFGDEVKAVDYWKAAIETDFYKVGYEWAKKKKNKELLRDYEEFFDGWNEGTLTYEELDTLHYTIDTLSVIYEMGRVTDPGEVDPKEPKRYDDGSMDIAIMHGVMMRVKELVNKKRSRRRCTVEGG